MTMQGKMEDYPVYQYFENYVAVFAEIHQYYSEPLLNNDHPLWLTIQYWGTHGRTTAFIRCAIQLCTGRAEPYGAPAAVRCCHYCHAWKWLGQMALLLETENVSGYTLPKYCRGKRRMRIICPLTLQSSIYGNHFMSLAEKCLLTR